MTSYRWLRDTPVEERIQHYDVIGECWIWKGNKDKDGYGFIKHKRRTQKVHRVAYELWCGELERGKCVCHICDNPSCINPEHLWQGTVRENNEDAIEKGRNKWNPNPRDEYGRFT